MSISPNLKFRRQFLLAPEAVKELEAWPVQPLGKHGWLYAHPDLPLHHGAADGRQVFLAGFVVDAARPERTTEQILAELLRQFAAGADLGTIACPLGGRWRDAAQGLSRHYPQDRLSVKGNCIEAGRCHYYHHGYSRASFRPQRRDERGVPSRINALRLLPSLRLRNFGLGLNALPEGNVLPVVPGAPEAVFEAVFDDAVGRGD
jgi:hypothetical protein